MTKQFFGGIVIMEVKDVNNLITTLNVKDIITMITAIIGCVTGVTSLLMNIVSLCPRYKIVITNITLKPLDNNNIPSKYNDPSMNEAKLKMLKKSLTHYIQITVTLFNYSKTTQLLEGVRYTFMQENAPMISSTSEKISNINATDFPITLKSNENTCITVNYLISENLYKILQKNLCQNTSVGKLCLYTYNDIIEKDIIIESGYRVTIKPSKHKINYHRTIYKLRNKFKHK